MARSHRNLWPQLTSWDNLLLAYRRCRRRKRHTPGAVRFDFQWESELLQLQRELRDGSYRCGPYRNFRIRDPKPRLISAAPFRDRVIHHAVVQMLEPIYERRFIHDSYACRRGKGTHRAAARCQTYLRRHRYCLKTDIVKFFPNVDHQLLLELIARTVADEELMNLIRTIIASGEGVLREEATPGYFPGDDLFAVLRPTGLPIGNLTSQFLANVLLDQSDHFLKEQLRVPGLVRYADYLLLFADAKSALWEYRAALTDELGRWRLRLHPRKTQVVPSRAGVNFLGLRLTPHTSRLSSESLRRFQRKRRRLQQEFAAGRLDAASLGVSLRAWQAHADQATHGRKLLRLLRTRGRFFGPLSAGRSAVPVDLHFIQCFPRIAGVRLAADAESPPDVRGEVQHVHDLRELEGGLKSRT